MIFLIAVHTDQVVNGYFILAQVSELTVLICQNISECIVF